MKIVTAQEMRRLEESASNRGISTDDLMERAGLAVAQEVRKALRTVAGKRVLVLVGPGNNGGDGLVAARHLARWGASVTAYLATKRQEEDPKLDLALREEVTLSRASNDAGYQTLDKTVGSSHAVIDAILGTGRARPLDGAIKDIMLRLGNRQGVLIALDLPTGVDADTGEADPAAPRADITLTLGFPKVGLFRFPAAEQVGRLKVLDIGIPMELAQDIPLEMLTPSRVRDKLPRRTRDSHKGTYGHALIIGGSVNYPGAAYLATQGALRSGPGLVTLATPRSIQPMLASKLTEAIHLPVPDDGLGSLAPEGVSSVKEALSQYSSLAIGCGMGHSDSARRFVIDLLLSDPQPTQPLVVDADGLNILAAIEGWWDRLKTPAILTPHPGEMSRLTGVSTPKIQARRVDLAREWSARWGKVVVLKGAFTVVASPGGTCWVSPFANPVLATGGTGDVLTGVIAGLLAQGLALEDAACCGVYLHGATADRLSAIYGDRGATAGDLLDELPATTKAIIES